MGQARSRGTFEERRAAAIDRDTEADKKAAERDAAEAKERQIGYLAKSIALGVFAASVAPTQTNAAKVPS